MTTEASLLDAPSPPRGRSLVFAATFFLLALLSVLVAFIPHIGFVALSAVYVGIFLAYMGLRSDPQGGDVFEVITPVSILGFVYFGVGTLYLVFVPEALSFPALAEFLLPAQALATLAFLCFIVGYGTAYRKTAPSPVGRWVPNNLLVYLIPAFAGALGMSMGKFQLQGVASDRGISASLSFLQQFGPLFYFAWFLSWYMTWSGRLRKAVAVPLLLGLSALAAIILFFNFGGKTLAVTLLGLPVMAFYEVRRKLPIKSVLAVVLIFIFVIFPIFNTYRAQNRTLDTTRRLDMTVTVARSWNSNQFLDASVFAFFSRMTIVTSLAAVVSDTGRWVDYRYGETLILAPIGLLIPRFVWPSKPALSIGKEFGETFRLVTAMDRETEVAIGMVGDLYWNFAVPGVVIGMWLLGMGYRWFYQRYGAGRGFDPMRKSIYAMLLPGVLLIEGNVAIMIAGFAKVLIILHVLLILCRRFGWFDELSEA